MCRVHLLRTESRLLRERSLGNDVKCNYSRLEDGNRAAQNSRTQHYF